MPHYREERRDQDTRVGLCVDRVGRRQPEGGGAQSSQVVEDSTIV